MEEADGAFSFFAFAIFGGLLDPHEFLFIENFSRIYKHILFHCRENSNTL